MNAKSLSCRIDGFVDVVHCFLSTYCSNSHDSRLMLNSQPSHNYTIPRLGSKLYTDSHNQP